jgi:serine/threonine protein kinase
VIGTWPIPIGAVLAHRYRVERVLGQGGMGVVIAATHLQLQQLVAMKFLLPEMLGNVQVVQRFLREAQAAVRLRSEHVARVIDVGSLENGAPYMVLEYLEGADLSAIPRAQLTVGGIIDLMLQACEALAEAHSIGIVHRDIKPANFFVTRGPDGKPLLKVLDFGISKAPVTGSNLTGTQSVMGTPAYMSPEQMRSSRDVDHRSDIWALGVVLYELLQGAPPFGGDTFSSMVLRVVTEPLPRLTVALPGDLDAVIYRCLEKDPARRFQNVAELARALAKYASSPTQAALSVQRTGSIVGGPPPTVISQPNLAAPQAGVPSTLSGASGAVWVDPGARRSRWPIFAAAGVVVGAGAIIAIVLATRGDGTTPSGPASQPDKAEAAAPPPAPPPTTPSTTPPATPPPATTPPPVTPPPVTPPPPAVATTPPETGSATGSAEPPAAGSATATTVKKPRKPRPPKHDGSGTPSDDDILGTRK